MNLLLLKMGFPAVVIRPEERLSYFEALDAARAGHRPAYYAFLDARLEAALDHHLEILRRSLA